MMELVVVRDGYREIDVYKRQTMSCIREKYCFASLRVMPGLRVRRVRSRSYSSLFKASKSFFSALTWSLSCNGG